MATGRDGSPLPHLTISQLEYLVAVAESESWAQAADRVGVSPSALSQGLAELERRLGLQLFGREGRRRTLLPETAVVVDFARRVLADTGDLARWVEQARGGETGTLRVGMIDVAAVHHCAEALAVFRRDRPEVDLRLTVAPSGQLARSLARGDLDLAVLVEPGHLVDGIDMEPLLTEDLVVYGPADSPVGKPSSWGPFVGFPDGSHTRAHIVGALTELGVPVSFVAESHQPDVLCEMVRLGLGWTVLPAAQAEAGDRPLRRARKSALLTRQLMVCRRHHATPHPAADALRMALLS